MQDTYIVTAPDGTQYEVEAPEGVTGDDVIAQVKKSHEAGGDRPSRMSTEDEVAYSDLTEDRNSTPEQIMGFLRQRGFNADERTVRTFVRNRNRPGAIVGSAVRYGLPKAPPKPKGPDNTLREDLRGAAAQFVDSVLPGSAKAARGTREVILNAARAPFTDEDFDPSTAYAKGEEEIERNRRQFEQDNPNIASGVGLAGFGTGFLVLPEAKIFKGGSIGAGVANGMITGAAYGGASGLMNDTGGGRLENAALGTAAGSLLGGVAPVAVRGAAEVGAAARRNIPGVDTAARVLGDIPRRLAGRPATPPDAAAHAQAERMLGDMLPQGQVATGMGSGNLPATPDNIADEVARRAGLQVPAAPADVSEQGRRITSWALQGQGPMAQRARSVLSARQAQAGQRIRGHLADELGGPVDPIAEAEAITRRARAAAEPAYAQAYAEGSPMVIDQELRSIMGRPAFQDAIPQAYRNIRNRGGDPEAMGFSMLPDGSVSLSQQPTFEAFDQVGRTLNAGIKRSELTGRPILDNESGGINDVMSRLDQYLRDINPSFDAAKTNFADEMAVKDAMARGQDLPNATGPEIEAQLRSMPQHAQESWMAGGRTALADVATKASLRPTANVAQRVRQAFGLSGAGDPALGDVSKLGAIETMSGRPGVVNRIDDRLEAEDQAFKTFSETFGNSKTQPRQAMDDAMSGQALQTAGRLLSGNWAGAAASLLLRGNPAGTLRYKQAVQDRIAQIMTETNPQSAREAMDAIMARAQSDDRFRRLLNDASIPPARMAALYAAAQDAQEAPSETEEPLEAPAYTRIQP